MRKLRLAVTLIICAIGAANSLANVKSVDTYRIVQDPDAPGAPMGALDASGPFLLFAAGSSQTTGYLFDDTQLSTPLARFNSPHDFPSSGFGWDAAISPDFALIGSFNEQTNYFFDVRTGALLQKFPGVGGIAIDGDRVAVGHDSGDYTMPGSASLYGASTGLVKRFSPADLSGDPLHGDYAFGIATTVDGDTVVVGSSGTRIAYVYDATDGKLRTTLQADEYTGAFGATLSADDGRVLVGAPVTNNDSGKAYLFDTHTGQKIFEFLPPAGTDARYFGDAVYLKGQWALIGAPRTNFFTGSSSGAAYLFSTVTGQLVAEFLPDANHPVQFFGGRVAISDHYFIFGSVDNVPDAIFLSPIQVPEPTAAAICAFSLVGSFTLCRRRPTSYNRV